MKILILLYFISLKTASSSWNRTSRFDQKPAYFNFDLKHYDDLGVISNEKIFKKYGFRHEECQTFWIDNSDYIYFIHKRNWLAEKIIYSHKTNNNQRIDRPDFFSWSDFVKFYMINSNLYTFKRHKNVDLGNLLKINSIFKLSDFYYTYTSCLLKENKTFAKYLPMLIGRVFPSPCGRERCEFIEDASREGLCTNQPMPVYEYEFTCKCKSGYEFATQFITIKNHTTHKIYCKKMIKLDCERLRNCSSNGVCVNDACVCNHNYEGPDCSLKKNNITRFCSNGNCSNSNVSMCRLPFMRNLSISFPNCLQRINYEPACDRHCFKGFCKNSSW